MKLVINIPEETYEALVINQYCGSKSNLEDIIVNGTPLLKGHGDLVDRDALIYKQTHHCGYQTPFRLIDENNLKNAPTIIEADTEK